MSEKPILAWHIGFYHLRKSVSVLGTGTPHSRMSSIVELLGGGIQSSVHVVHAT